LWIHREIDREAHRLVGRREITGALEIARPAAGVGHEGLHRLIDCALGSGRRLGAAGGEETCQRRDDRDPAPHGHRHRGS
jgi:hypothetical protein